MEATLLSPEDVAAQCRLSRKAVYRAIERGELRASKLCSRLRIRPDDLDTWIEGNRLKKATPDALRPTHIPASNGLRALLADSTRGAAT
jgi:excisionase family DNA binding protein